MNRNERLQEAYGYLRSKGVVHTQKDLAQLMGTTAPNISSALKGVESVLTDKFLRRLNKACGSLFNESWLLSGDGDMLARPNEPRISYDHGVPYFNVDFIGGFDLVLNDQTKNPEYYIDFAEYNNADCWCNVMGHSMEPEISQGDMIALKELKDWRTYLPSGEIYGIVTTEHRTIKKITPSEREGYLRLIPCNPSPEFVAQEIPVTIVERVYRVLGCVKRL